MDSKQIHSVYFQLLKMKKFHIYILFVSTSFFTLKGIDPHFSQFYATPIYQAPSYAGSTGGDRISLNYRDQWPSLAGYFTSSVLSYDTYLQKYNSGLGFLYLRDQIGKGKMTTNNIGVAYSYKIKLGSYYYLQPGLLTYYTFHNINSNYLTFRDQIVDENQTLPSSIETGIADNYSHLDFASSMLFYNEYTWAGVTLDHLMNFSPSLQHNSNYAPIKLSVYGGYKFILQHNIKRRDETSLMLALNYKTQGSITQSDFGAYVFKLPLFCGLWYRGLPFLSHNAQDAVCLLLGVKNGNYSIGYTYDFTISGGLITRTGGAHELALSVTFPSKYTIKRRRGAIPCPSY